MTVDSRFPFRSLEGECLRYRHVCPQSTGAHGQRDPIFFFEAKEKSKTKANRGGKSLLESLCRAVFFRRSEQNPVSINISKVSHSIGC
jgi:hypothetical protein